MDWIEKLKTRWQVTSVFQVIIILLVFALTGFSLLFIKQPLYDLVGIGQETPGWIKTVFFIVALLPVYNAMLLFYGFVFGQFRFFWNFEKRMFGRIFRLGSKSTSPPRDQE